MGKLRVGTTDYVYQVVPCVDFEGARLEVLTVEGDIWFDVTLPVEGELGHRPFSKEVPHDVILAAVALTGQRDFRNLARNR